MMYNCLVYSTRVYNIIAACCRIGIIIFIVVYVIATRYYPGGSDFDRFSKGFDWLHNYWCELLATNTKTREVNTARPIAIGAFILLDVTLTMCWLQASFLFSRASAFRWLVIICGVLSGISMCFLSSPSHDLVINITGGFGLTALVLVLAGLRKRKFQVAFYAGIACIFLFFLNTYIYYTGNWFNTLAVVQKISFAAFLSWFWMIAGIAKPAGRVSQ
ncbi:MAG: hypothetical protein EOO05_12670 [Chitinophagaceae bacterium]|nr:MAG: hypothetical protein EOO05_12670 [Chitinophagaceae bacterium]